MRVSRLLAALAPFALATAALAATDVSAVVGSPAQAPIGGQTFAVVTLKNIGSTTASGTQLAYMPPSKLTFAKVTSTATGVSCATPPAGSSGDILCSIATIASQQSINITFTHNVPASVTAGTSLVFNTVVAAPGDTNASNDSSSSTTVAQPMPNVSIDDTFPATFVGGTTLSYSLTVHNNAGAASNISFSATTNQGFAAKYVSVTQRSGPTANCPIHQKSSWDCTFPTLGAGATAVFDVQLAFDPIVYGYEVEEDLTLTADSMDLVLAKVAKHGTATQVADADVSGRAPATIRSGDDLPFTVTLTNEGPSATNPTLTWSTPAGTTFVSVRATDGVNESAATNCTAPAAGATGTVTCTFNGSTGAITPGLAKLYVFRSHPTAPGTVVNTATVSGPNDPNASNNTASATTTVAEGPKADVSLTMRPDAYAVAGKPFTILFVFRNAGPDVAKGVASAFSLPPGLSVDPTSGCAGGSVNAVCSAGDLAAGAEVTKGLVLVASSTLTQATLSATAASATADPDTTNNTATATLPVYPPLADVAVSVAPVPSVVPPAGELVFQVTIANRGPAPATSGFAVTFPAGSTFISAPGCANLNSGAGAVCSAKLFAGGSAEFRIHIGVPPAPGAYSLAFHLTSDVPDANLADNDATVSFTVSDTQGASADLATTVQPAEVTVAPGAKLNVVIAVENRGTNVPGNVALHATLPAGMTIVSATTPDGTCAGTTQLDCSIPSLAVGATAIVRISVSAPATAGIGTVDVTASSAVVDPVAGNNSASLRVTVVDHPRRRPAGH